MNCKEKALLTEISSHYYTIRNCILISCLIVSCHIIAIPIQVQPELYYEFYHKYAVTYSKAQQICSEARQESPLITDPSSPELHDILKLNFSRNSVAGDGKYDNGGGVAFWFMSSNTTTESGAQQNCSILLVNSCSSSSGGGGVQGGIQVVEEKVDCNGKYSFICNVTSKSRFCLFFMLIWPQSSIPIIISEFSLRQRQQFVSSSVNELFSPLINALSRNLLRTSIL